MDYQEVFELSTEHRQLLSTAQAWYLRIIPAGHTNGKLHFFYEEEKDVAQLQNELEVLLGREVALKPVPSDWITRQLNRHYPNNHQRKNVEWLNSQSKDLLSMILDEAAKIKSSDIHLEPYEERCRVRFRIDGKLVERYVIPTSEYPAIVNKIKIKSHLDISEKRLPQDGRIIYEQGGAKFDLRVSVLPTLYGEKVVLRLLNRDATQIQIDRLGFSEVQLAKYLEGIKNPNGLILISGPTGSGKTTTLYATLKLLNRNETNILTIEDPIEYMLEGINQVQLKEAIGLTFGSALRTFLRQDPDIIMVGEIRDGDTAQMAVRAALTGHLVLSTVHTNSAWGTISRLIDMGIPPYLISSTVKLSIAQRLVRKLCPHCKKEEAFNATDVRWNYRPEVLPENHFTAVGCPECFYTGYHGRIAVYEVITIDDDLREMIRRNELNATEYYERKKMKTLSDQAFQLLVDGTTSLEEVYAILSG
ncbi:general secretion pathway protein GspE [Prolixibacter bellariivorans]|uniref:General secretion pathway protein GspE n=1 Tax=Prolixibacter bellariivorans TaxID=314319 RepID=A0A5M4B278_9BACT|nr:GspE/PulE family protein [Prolixibacter bellariivorans]GET34222.1 general secretion pathway protein GspE [Prolixibacter bellariivorans]